MAPGTSSGQEHFAPKSPGAVAAGAGFFAASAAAIAVVALDGTVGAVNAAWTALLGARSARPIAESIVGEDRAALAAAVTRVREGHAAQVTLRLARGDGSEQWLACELTPEPGARSYYCEARDVTETKAALARMERSEVEFRRLIEHVPDGIVVMREGQFVHSNPAAARILGYDSAKQLLGLHFSSIVRPEELPHSVQRVRQMTAGPPPPRAERPMVRRDGTTVRAETIGFATQFDGSPATLVIAHDVTEEHGVQAQVRQADRLASLGLLAAGVAHELNNPLAYVLLNMAQVRKWLKQVLAGSSMDVLGEALRLVEQSLDGSERMRVILGDLRTFARLDDRQSALVDVAAVMDSIIPIAEHLFRSRAVLVRDYGEVPLVRANEARLGQVFLNLVVNAAQAIPEGSLGANSIEVSIRSEDAEWVVVRVRDSGVGMPPEVLARVFDPFFTTKSADNGTGLGLSVCLNIVKGLEGTIIAESELGRGSCFSVTLPAVGVKGPAPARGGG